MSKQAKGVSVTRTLRIDEDIDSTLQLEADRQGMSKNALINKILLHYKDELRFHEAVGELSFESETFSLVLNHLDIEEIEEVADTLRSRKVQENLMRKGRELNYENVLWFIKQIQGEYGGWFRCDIYREAKADRIHLSHGVGKNWSHFLDYYLSNIFIEALGIKIQSVVLENNVHITIPK